MSKKFGLRLLVVAVALAVCTAFSYSPQIHAIDGYNAMPGDQLDPPGRSGTSAGWIIDFWYIDMDSCNTDSFSSYVDTQYTDWVYVGNTWEAFWVYFDWYAADTQAATDSLDTLESVTIQGCLDPTNYPTTVDYTSFFTPGKADTFTQIGYHGLDSLGVDPPYPWIRAQIIFEVTAYFDDWCSNDTLEGATTATHNKQKFELRYKTLDIY